MAISANTYAEHDRVETRISDVLVGGLFTTGTRPTLAQAEQILDDVAAQMNAILESSGYTAPVTSADQIALDYCESANAAGACVQIFQSFPSEAWDPDTPDPQRNRISGLASEFDKWVKMVEAKKLNATRNHSRTHNFIVGAARDRETGDLNNPLFDRGSDSYPGRVSLTDGSQ